MQQKIDTPRCLDFFLRARSHQVECDERCIHDVGFSDPSISDRTLLWEGILNAHRSAVEFQYAWELEQAITIGGSHPLVEARLGRPCRHLEGYVPLDMVESAGSFPAVESYLQRVELGTY